MDGFWMVVERPWYTHQYAVTIHADYGAAIQHANRSLVSDWLVRVTNRIAVIQFLYELSRNANADGYSVFAFDALRMREN